MKFNGRIYIGKGKIKIKSGGKLTMHKNATLYIGVNYSYPVATVIDIYSSEMIIEGDVFINRGSKIRVYNNGKLFIGNNSYINEGAKVYCSNNVTIGKECAIAFNTTILDTDIHEIYKDNKCINKSMPIIIGNNVWIGANTVVLKGTIIHDNVIVGAQSTVKGELESNNIYAGNPIASKGLFDSWKA